MAAMHHIAASSAETKMGTQKMIASAQFDHSLGTQSSF